MQKTIFEGKPQDVGYKLFFSNLDPTSEMHPMQLARATYNRNSVMSDPIAISNIANDYMAGPMHFGMKVERKTDYQFFDVDMMQAYPTFLVNYARGNFSYKVGSNKRYYYGLSFFTHKTEGMRIYKIRFTVRTEGREQSRLYRRWLLKTTKIRNMLLTDEYISGILSLPDIDDLVNRFLDEVQGYAEHDVVIDSITVAEGANSVFINEKRISDAMRQRNNPNNPYRSEYKMMLNASTGYLSYTDKVLYYTMINQIRMELFKYWDRVDRWNLTRPELPISIVAANTDGLTLYAHKDAIFAIKDIIREYNNYSIFNFQLKEVYDFENAHFTENDIRRQN